MPKLNQQTQISWVFVLLLIATVSLVVVQPAQCQTDELPEHAVQIIGDTRYIFGAKQITFVNNENVAAFNDREAAVIEIATGKVTRIKPEKVEEERVWRKGFGSRWFVTQRREDSKSAVEIINVTNPDDVRTQSFVDHVTGISESGDFALVPNLSKRRAEVVEIDTGDVVSSWDLPDPKKMTIQRVEFAHNETAIIVGARTTVGGTRYGYFFLEYSKQDGKIGDIISKTQVHKDLDSRSFPDRFGPRLILVGNGMAIHDFRKNLTGPVKKVRSSVVSAEIDSQSQYVAHCGYSGSLEILDLNSGREVASIDTGARPTSNVAFSPDGKLLAVSIEGRIRFWSTKNGKEKFANKQPGIGAFKSVAISPDEKMLAVADGRGRTQVWNLKKEGSRVELPNDSNSGAMSEPRPGLLAFSNKGDYLLGGSNQSKANVNIWNMKTGKMMAQIQGHKYSVDGVAWSSDDSLIASVGRDYKLRVFDKNARPQGEFANCGTSVEFLPDSAQVVAMGTRSSLNKVKLFDLRSQKMVREFDPDTRSTGRGLSVSPKGDLVAGSYSDRLVVVWDSLTGETVYKCEVHGARDDHFDDSSDCAFSPDGKYLAAVGGSNEIKIFDAEDGKLKHVFEGNGVINSLAFGKKHLYSASDEQQVIIWKIPE